MAARAIKKADVVVGEVYIMKVSGRLAEVRILRVVEIPGVKFAAYSGRKSTPAKTCWDGVNLKTGREVRIRSAAKLRLKVSVVAGANKAADAVVGLTAREMFGAPNGTEGNLTPQERLKIIND